jgi:hypothetical protein
MFHVLLSTVLESAGPGGIARLDVELDALVVTKAGRGGGSGGRRRRSGLRHGDVGFWLLCITNGCCCFGGRLLLTKLIL